MLVSSCCSNSAVITKPTRIPREERILFLHSLTSARKQKSIIFPTPSIPQIPTIRISLILIHSKDCTCGKSTFIPQHLGKMIREAYIMKTFGQQST
uniref:Putative ovule protein n=1 Tax=Solanum chacoense TaxID=4108 RepID=A0A0V0III0_SOLCH